MSLRDHLLAAQVAAGQVSVAAAPSADIHTTPPSETRNGPSSAGGQIDLSMAYDSSPGNPPLEPQNPDVRKGRRELSTSKRAAQNRAAQRAFRQRKEQYIGSLKAQVSEYEQIASHYKVLEHENLLLREYVIQLQSRLLANGDSDMPPPPLDLSRPSARIAAAAAAAAAVERDAHVAAAAAAHEEAMSVEAQLQAAAAAADDDDDDDSDEHGDLSRQLHAAAEAAIVSARSITGTAGGAGEGDDKDDEDDDDEDEEM